MDGGRTALRLRVPTITVEEAVGGDFLVVDVRSPREFQEGSMPGAVNMPLLDDEQRAVVGATYKQEGARHARLAALDAVSPGLPAYLSALAGLTRGRGHPEGGASRRLAVMCWRGGERSRNVVLLLALIGVHAVQVDGGYKAYRRMILDGLARWSPGRTVVTLYGETGAGKTALMKALVRLDTAARLRPWVVDLEGLALHRGSLLGGLNQPGQRTQKQFDGLLWEELRRPRGDYLVLEGESAKIGRLYLPASVTSAIRAGVPILVWAGVKERVHRILAEYSPQTWTEEDRGRFRSGLRRIVERLPAETRRSLERSFTDGRFAETVEGLLVSYYDPLYRRSCVEGKVFALEFETGPDPDQDARRFVRAMARLLRATPATRTSKGKPV